MGAQKLLPSDFAHETSSLLQVAGHGVDKQ